ncbi:phosphoribosylanthranilate isomerase [Paenibacillus sp. CC-CFT747]|nr:phosphoribosylanthranilate isomerase [Paenibacillus sp. CC-CFT747]
MTAAEVKICGITDEATLERILSYPIDYIGFMFAPSKRRITAAQAGRFLELMRATGLVPLPRTVGVFVNPTEEYMSEVMEQAKLDVIQLHGQESPLLCRYARDKFGVKVFKVISIRPDSGSKEAEEQLSPYRGAADAILLDTFEPVHGGGGGKTFAWDLIPGYREAARKLGMKLLVAGGLTSDNVAGLIERYQPDGVDVSSGVETEGVKDSTKILAFVERVKGL